MKSSKSSILITPGLLLLLIFSTSQAQVGGPDVSAFQLKSPGKAQSLSALSTFGPVATGVLWWALDGPEDIKSYSPDGRLRGYYPENPDRTGPVILILSGIMVGPSVGYFYSDCADRGAKGIMLRVGIGALTMMAAGKAASAADTGEPFDFSGLAAALAVGAVGAGIITIDAIYDIAKVKSTVEKHNNELIHRNQISITLLPKYFTDSGAGGLELQVTF